MSEIILHISDMNKVTSDTKSNLLARVKRGGQGSVWTARDFLDLGSRDAVDKVLQRLQAAGTLRRIGRGLYDNPSMNSLTQKNNPPNPRMVIDAIARRDQIRILVDGLTAANDLGLSNAVPAKIIVHTDARLKPISLGQLDIIFKPTAPSKLFWAGRPAMRIVQALHWLRDTMSQSQDDDSLRNRLAKLLNDPQHGADLRDDLNNGLMTLPVWMQNYLRPLLS